MKGISAMSAFAAPRRPFFLRSAAAGLSMLLLAPVAAADEIADDIRNALALYEAGKVNEANDALDFASQLLAQAKAKGLTAFLPAPQSGWTAEDEESAGAMYGVGISAARNYRKDNQNVEVRIIGDSPMMQAMSMLFSNPAMVGASGGKLQRLGKQRAVVTQDGDVQIMAGKYLVTVSGDAPQDVKLSY